MARWARPERGAEKCWISADSDPAAPIVYAEAELTSWMPLPTPLPKLRAVGRGDRDARPADEEMGGSGI